MKELKLTNGKKALVDEEDYEKLIKFRWHERKVINTSYAYRASSVNEQRNLNYPKCIHLHRQILNIITDKEKFVDHIDCNGLNNLKSNIRICTKKENHQRANYNLTSRKKTSKYRGVSFMKNLGKFKAEISINGKNKHLGLFLTEKEAALAYNTKAIEIRGIFANLNIIV